MTVVIKFPFVLFESSIVSLFSLMIKRRTTDTSPPAAILYYLMPGMETTGCRLASSQVKAIPSVVVVG